MSTHTWRKRSVNDLGQDSVAALDLGQCTQRAQRVFYIRRKAAVLPTCSYWPRPNSSPQGRNYELMKGVETFSLF